MVTKLTKCVRHKWKKKCYQLIRACSHLCSGLFNTHFSFFLVEVAASKSIDMCFKPVKTCLKSGFCNLFVPDFGRVCPCLSRSIKKKGMSVGLGHGKQVHRAGNLHFMRQTFKMRQNVKQRARKRVRLWKKALRVHLPCTPSMCW